MSIKASKWMVYWYDEGEWNELLLTDAPTYAEHLFTSRLECILIPKKAYDDPKNADMLDVIIKDELCVLPANDKLDQLMSMDESITDI